MYTIETGATPADNLVFMSNATANINLRSGPSTDYSVVGTLQAGDSVSTIGRNTSGDWLQILFGETDSKAWVFASLVTVDDDIQMLPIVDVDSEAFSSINSYVVSTGIGESSCAKAPNGILIQTPEGVGEVSLAINEVNIRLGSTAFLTVENGSTTIALLEGTAILESQFLEEAILLPSGAQSKISELEDESPLIEPYNIEPLQDLPLDLLQRSIEISPPIADSPFSGIWYRNQIILNV